MQRSTSDAVAFFAPGLVHQFGNLLLTIQGHALNLEPDRDALGRCRDAILGASERGGDTLRFLRHLLGEPGGGADDVFELADRFAELARVPVREARQVLELHKPGVLPRCLVDINDFLPCTAEALRALVAAIPDGVHGAIRMSVTPQPATVTVRLQFAPIAGSLPFPLGIDELAERVETIARRRGWRSSCRSRDNGLDVQMPRAADRGEPSDGLHGSFSIPT